MTDHPSLYGPPTGSTSAIPDTVREDREGDASEMSFHLHLNHPRFGLSLLAITKHHRDLVHNGRVTRAANSRTVSLRGLTAETMPLGSVEFNGPRNEAVHFLNQHMVREEDVKEGGSMAPLSWLAFCQGASIPAGTSPSALWTLLQGIPSYEQLEHTGQWRVSYVMPSKAFPEISFKIDGPWLAQSNEGLLKRAWWTDFNKKFRGTIVSRYGSAKSAL